MSSHKDLRPDDLEAYVDTREQAPLDLLIPSRVMKLDVGDYSLRGLTHMVCVERKSISDLVMCCGRERERFERCIERMRHYPLAMLVIEGSESTVELKQYRGEMHPNAVLGAVHSWRAKGINIDWAGDRQRAAIHISRTLFAFARERHRELGAFHQELNLVTKPPTVSGAGGRSSQEAS